MATSKPMLGDLELQQVQKIEIDEDQSLAQQSVPALEGDFLQRLGRRATQIGLTGVLTGDEAGAGLKTLQEKFRAAEPVSFVADIATATKVDQVLIEELGMRELAGKPERFEYALTLHEYTPPPKPEPPAPQPPPPEPPSVDTGKLVVDVTVTGQPGFDFSTITVSVAGTQDDGTQLNRTITQRSENTWTDDQMPPGQYTVTAMESDAQSLSGSASATIQVGQTTQVSITLTPATNIAQTFIVHYRIDKAFIEPAMRQVLKQVADYAQAHTDEKLLIVGHTDLTRNPSIPNYNQSLSERRARGVYAYLTFGGDVGLSAAALDEWNALRAKRPAGEDPSIKDSWDVHEYQHILQDLGFYPGNVDGIDGPLTQNAVSAYRCKKGLPPGTTVDDQTWEALIKDYLSQEPLSIPEIQFLPNCGNEILKWLGCGEKDPVKNISSAWRPNRRTELLFVQADKLPCQVPQPVTFDLPTKGTVNSGWCVGGAAAQLTCFVTPAKDSCSSGSATSWCRQPAEPGTLTVQGSIKREQADGSFAPVANQKFVLIAPDGQFKAGEQSNGEPQAARTGKDGSFTFSNLRVGVYSLEVIAPVLVRLAEDSDASSKGNAVIKHLSSDTDRLDVVIANAPNLREITLPVAAHLMTALHPLTREVRTCPAAGGGAPLLQATAHTDDDIRTAFATASDIWQQARIQFNLTDIVREAYAFRTDCEIDQSEFQIILERCAYPGAVNVFFVGDLAGTGEAGGTISPEDGASLNIAGCSVGDRFQAIILGFPQDITLDAQQTAQVLAHELGHYLNLPHVDETPANANRLMLASTQDGSNRTLIQDEVNSARASKGASDNCVSLTLKVTGATQVGGVLSNKYIVLQNAATTVTVDATIPDSLLDPSRGTLIMTGGNPGASNRQRTVSAATKGAVQVVATYTPAGGGDAVTAQVEIRVATFALSVDGATQTGGANSTTFVALRDAKQVVTVKAVIDPELFSVPSNLVTWAGGTAVADPLRRTVSRANAASTTVSATVAGTTKSVTIIINLALIDVIETATASAPPLASVRIGLWDNAFDSTTGNLRNDPAEATNFIGADSRHFFLRVQDPAASGEVHVQWRTVFGDGTNDDARTVSQYITLLETGSHTGVFLSKALFLVTDDVDQKQSTNSGLPAGNPDAGIRTQSQSNHRIRKITVDDTHQLDSKMIVEYTPSTGGTALTATTFVFNRSPEERRRLRVHLVNVRSTVGGKGILTADRRNHVKSAFQSIYAVCGIFAQVDDFELDPPASCIGWGKRYTGDHLAADPSVEEYSFPKGSNNLAPSASQTDLINAVRALPTFNAGDIYIICVANIYDTPLPPPPGPGLKTGTLGNSFPDSFTAAGSISRGFGFAAVTGRITVYTEAHETTHITTDLRNAEGGHYYLGLPGAKVAGPIDGKNLMRPFGLADNLGVSNPKRLWNTTVTNMNYSPAMVIPAQIDTIRASRFIKPF